MSNFKATTLEQSVEVNQFARRTRHLKIFSKLTLVKIHALDFSKWLFAPLNRFFHNRFFQAINKSCRLMVKVCALDFPSISPQKKLLGQSIILALFALVGSSFSGGATIDTMQIEYSADYIGEYSMPGDVLIADENGYMMKINPQTDKANRIGMTDYAVHTVESGESLSAIAQQYGISVETIMWENKIANANSLRVGQKLMIPPVSGISYKIASGDTLEKVAKKFSVTKEAIIAQNGLESEALIKGQNLFLPGAKPIAPVSTVASNYKARTNVGSYTSSVSATDAKPSVGKFLIFPTTGSITQQFHTGHYALDIANSSRPAIWAAAAGTVVKASSGTWGGGYGNHVIIDHGNGIKTLYGHMTSLNVVVGQQVEQGDVIGIMGNTGRVYGITGIHLHFEVIDNGVKRNPKLYY